MICRLSSAGFKRGRVPLQVSLDLGLDRFMVQEPLIRGCGLVVMLGDVRTVSGFAYELGRGQKVVGQEAERPVELLEALELLVGVHAGVADGLTHDGVVFLLDEAVVVLAVGRGSG